MSKLFTLKIKSHRWWHWITHPIRTRQTVSYLKDVEAKVHKKINRDKLIRACSDLNTFGYATYFVEEEDDV